jgi:phenylpropionate dioxygenase-like ring-hydroxylating dioxygenase large terminal subunit
VLVSQVPALRHHPFPVAFSHELADQPLARQVLATPVVLWRSGTAACAAIDRCPHRSAKLSLGSVHGTDLVCPYHGWCFGPGGDAVHIPQLDDGVPMPPRAALDMVEVTERYGLVWVVLEQPAAALPVFEEAEAQGWRLIPEIFERWDAAAPRIIDNALDLAHVGIVHAGSVGERTTVRVPPYHVQRTRTGLRQIRWDAVPRGPRPAAEDREVPIPGERWSAVELAERADDLEARNELVGPLAFVGRIRYGTGQAHVILTVATPIDDGASWFVQVAARNDTEEEMAADDVVALDRQVTAEDRRIVESTDDALPLDPRAEVHLRADRLTLEYRRWLADFVATGDTPQD